MTPSFSNILIPVDFSINTEVAIQKALWLSDSGTSVIHILHISRIVPEAGGFYVYGPIMPVPVLTKEFESQIQFKLQETKTFIQKSLPRIEVNTHFIRGEVVQQSIIEFANEIKPKLIIIGKNKNHNWFPFLRTVNSSAVSGKTNCPVLTVKPGGIANRMKSIVIPVGSTIPKRKIELLIALTRSNRPKIHLVTMHKNNDFSNRSRAFLDTYRTLSECLHYPVEYKILRGNNFAKAFLGYARSIMADLIILNPNEESKINSFSGTQTNDLILSDSKLSVLTAEPFYN